MSVCICLFSKVFYSIYLWLHSCSLLRDFYIAIWKLIIVFIDLKSHVSVMCTLYLIFEDILLITQFTRVKLFNMLGSFLMEKGIPFVISLCVFICIHHHVYVYCEKDMTVLHHSFCLCHVFVIY